MKLLTLSLLISLDSFSAAWFPIGKPDAKLNYFEKSVCEKTESHPCHDVSACPLDTCDLIDGELIENPDKAFAKELKERNKEAAIKAGVESKKAALEKLKNADPDKANSIAALRAIVKDLLEVVKE